MSIHQMPSAKKKPRPRSLQRFSVHARVDKDRPDRLHQRTLLDSECVFVIWDNRARREVKGIYGTGMEAVQAVSWLEEKR